MWRLAGDCCVRPTGRREWSLAITPLAERLLLIVDDERAIRDAIADVVADDFATIRQASDGFEALEMAGTERPDLVVLDLSMPRMGGVETCVRLRALPGFLNVPIIVLTAERADAQLRAAFAAGADDYLLKPFTIGQLRARCRILELRRPAAENVG